MTTRTSTRTDEGALRWSVERIVAQRCGHGAAVASIRRSRSNHSSSYPADVVTVRLTGDETFRLFLAYGFEPPSLDRLLDSYRHQAGAHGLALPDRDRMRRVVDCFRLHRVLEALASAPARKVPEGTVAKLVEDGARLCDSVC